MFCGASKATNKKVIKITKNGMRQQQLRLYSLMIMKMMTVVGRRELWLIHLSKKAE